MKKITALGLALVMTLSLLPMSVWAAGEVQFTGSTNRGNYGIFVFTEKNDTVFSCSDGVRQWGDNAQEYIGIPCYSEDSCTVYLAVDAGKKVLVDGEKLTTVFAPCATVFTNGNGDTENITTDVYALEVSKPQNGFTTECTVMRSYKEYDPASDTDVVVNDEPIIFVFDFAPALTAEGARNLGDFYLFTDLVDGVLTSDRIIAAQGHDNGERFTITIPCSHASEALENVYLAVLEWQTLNMNDVTMVGKWNTVAHWDDTQEVTYNIYSIAVTEPTTGDTAIKSGSYTYNDENGDECTCELNLIFDYTPVFTTDSSGFNARGVKVFTALSDTGVLSCDNSVNWQWTGSGDYVNVACGDVASRTVYLAANVWNSFKIDGVEATSPIGNWSTVTEWNPNETATYNIYELTVMKPTTGDTVEYTLTRADGDGSNAETFDIVFDFTPVLTGDTFRETMSLKLFTDLNGSELSFNGGVEQWGDESGEYVTVYCAPETSKTIYLGVDVQNTVTLNGNEPTNAIGKWSRTFFADWSQQEETETLNIYPLTVSKPADGDTVEYSVVNSWDWYDNNNTPDDDTDDTSGTESISFTLIFDFESHPSDPLFVKDGEDYIDFADVFSGFDYDWELYYMEWDEAEDTPIYHPFGNSSFTFVANDANGKDCSDKFSWNTDGTLHFDGDTFAYDDMPITLYIKDDTGYRHKLVIEDNVYSGWDRTYWKTYTTNEITEGGYTYGGCSTFTVLLTPEQAQFIDLPDDLTADNELVITVHDPGEEMWRALVNQAEEFEGISVFYQPSAKIGVKGGELPQVKYVGGPWTAVEFLELLYRDNYPVEDYGTNGNGNIYGKVFHETDRTVIIPEASAIRSAWIWVYSDGTEMADSVNVKVVLADDVGGAVTLEDGQSGKAVDLSRVEVMEREGFALAFEKKDGALVYEDGTLTYRYVGPTKIEDPELAGEFPTAVADFVVRDTAMNVGLIRNMEETPEYDLLTVRAPAGYTAKALDGHPRSGDSMTLWYCWEGLAVMWTYTLTWVNDAGEEYVEKISIETPSVEGAEPWMDHMYGGTIKKIDAERMLVTELTEDCGAEYQLSDGLAYVQYDSDKELDVSAIKDAVISVQAPKNAYGDLPVAYRSIWWYSGSQDDPVYNRFCDNIIEKLEGQVEVIDRLEPGENNETITTETNALLKQTIGDIEYYYSGDRGTRIIVVKWIYDESEEDNGAVYEYLRLDTSSYYCTLKSALGDVGDNVVVDKPMADVTQIPEGNIYLETRIHPQDKGYGQYFFELSLVDGNGNTFVEYHEDGYTIILPYSFMGEEWNYAMAKNLKEKPIINHYDKNFNLKKSNGAIIGEYTERGIEFKVDSFSPFLLSWDETVKDKVPSGGYPGGYYPIVTPDTPEEKPEETKPAETKPVEKPATPPVKDDVTPVPEDTTPDVTPSEPPVIDDGAVNETPSDDAVQDNSGVGLWIGVGLVALAAVVAVVIIMATRKKRRES